MCHRPSFVGEKMSTWRLQFPSKKEAVLSVARKSRIPLEQTSIRRHVTFTPRRKLRQVQRGVCFQTSWLWMENTRASTSALQVLEKDAGPVCKQDPVPPPAKGAERLLLKDCGADTWADGSQLCVWQMTFPIKAWTRR